MLFQCFKGFIADNMFHFAGALGGGLFIDSEAD